MSPVPNFLGSTFGKHFCVAVGAVTMQFWLSFTFEPIDYCEFHIKLQDIRLQRLTDAALHY